MSPREAGEARVDSETRGGGGAKLEQVCVEVAVIVVVMMVR